jgi:starch synthase
MKIGFLTPEFPHPKTGNSGGIGTSILNLSKGLTQLGHDVSILIYGQKEDEVFIENNITFYRIKNVKVKGISLFLTQSKVQKQINSLFANNQIDIIEAPDWTGFTSFIQPKCPLVIRLNGSDTYFCHLENRPVKWRNKFLEKRAFKKANGIISVSQFTGDETNKVFQTKRPFQVIPNAIDVQNFQAVTPTNHQKILYFGTLIRKKGLLELPLIFNEVHKKNPKAELLLVGKDSKDITSGSDSTWKLMQPLFNATALQKVRYLGSVPYSEIKQHIEQATVCVFPTFAEALPVSWLESMAMQKPIVASNVGWAPEIIDDGKDGFLEHPKNHLAYASKIVRILADDELQTQLGNAAREKIIEKFSIATVAAQSVAYYQTFLNTK